MLLLALAFGCKGGGDDPVGVQDPGDEDVNTASVSAQGGSVSFVGGAVTMDIPAGALSTEVQITVTGTDTSGLDGAVPDAVFVFEPDGLDFLEPVTVTVVYDVAKVPPGITQDALRLMDFTSGSGELVLGSLLDVDEGTVSGEIHGFSSYGAGRASDQQLGDVMADVSDAIEAQDQARLTEFEKHVEALRQDIQYLGPRIEAECLATDILSVKAGFLEQLLLIELVRDYLALDGVRSTDSLCGGLLGDATIKIEPVPDTLRPGQHVDLSATIVGPLGEELVGGVGWAVLPGGFAEVDPSGRVTALQRGNGQVIAAATDLPAIEGSVPIVVVEDLVVEVSPTELTVAAGETGILTAVVREADSGDVVEDVFVEWTIADPDVFKVVASGEYTRSITLEAQHRGATDVTACALNTGFCVSVPLTSVFNVEGLWAFEETLEVDVDLPATEICEVVGTVQIVQEGAAYVGSSNETSTCTYDPGDGSPPEVVVVHQEGALRSGTITMAGGFYHETHYPLEACRTSGWVTSSAAFSWATSVSGTTECLEQGDYYSVGPMTGYRP